MTSKDEFVDWIGMAKRKLAIYSLGGKAADQTAVLLAKAAKLADKIEWRPPTVQHGTATFKMATGGTSSISADVGAGVEVPNGAVSVTFVVLGRASDEE